MKFLVKTVYKQLMRKYISSAAAAPATVLCDDRNNERKRQVKFEFELKKKINTVAAQRMMRSEMNKIKAITTRISYLYNLEWKYHKICTHEEQQPKKKKNVQKKFNFF